MPKYGELNQTLVPSPGKRILWSTKFKDFIFQIQRQNAPIRLTFPDSVEEITDLHAILKTRDKVLKVWRFDDIVKDDDFTILLPLTQQETMQFDKGVGVLEVKWLNAGTVEFAEYENVTFVHRSDAFILGDSNEHN